MVDEISTIVEHQFEHSCTRVRHGSHVNKPDLSDAGSRSSSSPNATADPATHVDARIARRLGDLRDTYGYSMEELAARSGVSRSMISKIERGEVSATASTLARLAIGLGVALPSLLGFAVKGPARPLHPVTRRNEQERYTDPESGYQRRILTPPGLSLNLQLSECRLPAGARITFENLPGDRPRAQQIWMLKGEMNVRVGESSRRLAAGDCMAMTLDQPCVIHNMGTGVAHYLVAVSKLS